MSLRAYPMIEKEFEGHTWRRMDNDFSFVLTGDIYEVRFLTAIGIYHWLSENCSGYTETCIEDVEEYLEELKPEERFRIKDIVHAIKEDIKENGGHYIQYNVG